MELDALKDAWLRRPTRPAAARTVEQDVAAAMDRGQVIARRVRRRDWFETGVCVLMLPFFVVTAFTDEYTLVRAGGAVVALACILIPIRMRMARRLVPEPGLPVVEALRQETGYLEAQERLLRTAVWWYFMPLLIGVVLMILGPPGAPWRKLAMITGILVLYGFLVRVNWRVSQVVFGSRRQEITNLLRALTALEHDAAAGSVAGSGGASRSS